ncbi:MAG: MotA/TolQ/ExbB proton channel family protein [Planctomycetota bacterium]
MTAWQLLLDGGPVTWLLAMDALLLAVLCSERVLSLYGAGSGGAARAADLHRTLAPLDARDLGAVTLAERPELTRHLDGLRVLVWIAPLLGLLGTVDGMILVFDNLLVGTGRQAVLAEGIGAALLSTQLGLLVAIPGMLCERLLSRRAHLVALSGALAAARERAERCA